MLKYTIKRFLFIIPMMLGVILLVFSLINLVPGDPGRTILGITATQEAVDALNEELGYYDPFLSSCSIICAVYFLNLILATLMFRVNRC